VRPEITRGDAVVPDERVTQVVPLLREYWYEVIDRPPVTGATKVTVAVVDVVTMARITVFPGVVKGTAVVAIDPVPAPTMFRARILTEYDVPLISPVIVRVEFLVRYWPDCHEVPPSTE
jgi:hypothetical protein